MNWTGGSLQRTKNANKGILQKQKAYFAKARTQLQNNSNNPATNFRPNYLNADEDFNLTGQMSTFGAALLHQTGYSSVRKTKQNQPSTLRSNKLHMHYNESPLQLFPNCSVRKRAVRNGVEDAIVNTETRLLEADRERLLRQPDWIGIASSKPVNLRCLWNIEKDKIGKRRKTRGKLVQFTRRSNRSKRILPQSTVTGFAQGSTFQAIRNNANHIQIQIGSNALTNTHSTQLNEAVRSHSSSEPMLFDQEMQGEDPESFEVLSYKATTPVQHGMSSSLSDESPYCVLSQGRKPGPLQPLPQYADLVYGQIKPLNSNAARNEELPDKGSIHEYHIRHYRQGTEYPLRFIFRNPDSPVTASLDGDDMKLAEEVLPAGESELEHTSHRSGCNRRASILEPPTMLIDKEKPWRRFLAISDRSSGDRAITSEANIGSMRPSYTTSNEEAHPHWSQQATRGFRTQASTPSVLASLPSFKKPVYIRPSCANFGNSGKSGNKVLRNLDQDERLWQAFVFGNDNIPLSDKRSNHERDCELEMLTDFGESSKCLPLSVAVSPITHVPAQLKSGHPWGGGQDVTNFSPRSRTRMLRSPSTERFSKESNDEGRRYRMAERSLFGDKSVTHASMQNNMSCNTDHISSKNFKDTRTSRSSLDQSGPTKFVSSAAAMAKAQQCTSSSVYGISEESSKGLDLVDADRF